MYGLPFFTEHSRFTRHSPSWPTCSTSQPTTHPHPLSEMALTIPWLFQCNHPMLRLAAPAHIPYGTKMGHRVAAEK
jgi:hypothetical protein